jgi:tetratricopeptide (TPR) repeat protein
MVMFDPAVLPADILVDLRKGDKEMRAQEISNAAISYARARIKSPSLLLPRLLEATALLASYQPKKALPVLRKAVQIASDDVIAHRLLQGALVDSGDALAADTLEREMAQRDLSPSISIRRLLEWMQLLPESPTVALLLGDAHQLAQEWKEAESAYQKSMGLAPRWVRPRMNSAVVLLASGKATEATRRLEETLKLEPSNAQTQYILGDAYLSTGRTQDAINAYTKVQKSSPLALQAQLNIAQAHAVMNNLPAAVNSLNNAEKIAPRDPLPRAAIAELQMRQGAFPQAAASYEAALGKLNKKDANPTLRPVLLKQLVQAQMQSKQYAAARQTIQQGMTENHQDQAPWYCLLARVASAQSDAPSVESALKNALETDTELYATATLNTIEQLGLAGYLLGYYQSLWENTNNGVQADRARNTVRSVANTPVARIRTLQALGHLTRNASKYADEVRVREELVRLRPSLTDYYLLALAYDHNGEIPNALAYYTKTQQMLRRQPNGQLGALPRSESDNLAERIRVLKTVH